MVWSDGVVGGAKSNKLKNANQIAGQERKKKSRGQVAGEEKKPSCRRGKEEPEQRPSSRTGKEEPEETRRGMDVAANLRIVVDILSSPSLRNQGQLLGIGALLDELRINATQFHRNANMGNLSRMRTIIARLRRVLEVLLNRQLRATSWQQVPALSISNLIYRRAAIRKLRRSLQHFVRLTPSVWWNPEVRHRTQRAFSWDNFDSSVRGPMVGRSKLVKKMLRILLTDEGASVQVVPIVGGPGIGKSRLARFLLDHSCIKRHFEVRRWVHVSPLFDLPQIVKKMFAMEAYDAECQNMDLKQLAHRAMRGASYLIVMDDVWNLYGQEWPEWDTVMQALPPNGKIILTTRTPAIASRTSMVVRTSEPCFVQPLDQEYNSFFVEQWLGLSVRKEDHPYQIGGAVFTELVEIGRNLAKKCDGVPLLFEYTTSLLGESMESYFWKKVPQQFDMLPKNGKSNKVFHSAYASYEHLPSDLRGCFLYCSVFPSDHNFDAEDLADLLAAEGFIPPSVVEDKRIRFIQQLLDDCFYPVQEPEHEGRLIYRLHKILHMFACKLDEDSKTIVRADEGTRPVFSTRHASFLKKEAKDLPCTRHASLLVHPSTESFPVELLKWKKLKTLILLQQGKLPSSGQQCEIKEIPQEFCRTLRHLELLSLQATKIRKLPNKVELISRLRYLNLSRTDVKIIPSSVFKLQYLRILILSHCEKLQNFCGNTCNLVRLEKLNLEGCRCLVELPWSISKMKSLQYLNVLECSSLVKMPHRMGHLTNLQTLLGYAVSGSDGSVMSELQPLVHLHRLSLESLEKVLDLEHARDTVLQDKLELESLSLRWNMDAEHTNITACELLESLQPHQHLKELEIVAYEGDKLPSWMTSTEPYLRSLVEIRLANLTACETLPPLGLLPCLKIAEISGAETVSCVDDSFYGHNGTFPSLEKLTFSYMHKLEVWEHALAVDMFPRLAEVAIIQCPKLRALHMELPSVKKLILWMNNKMLFTLKGGLRGVAKSLEQVSICFGEELFASSDCEGLQDLGRLEKLEICGSAELISLPQGLQYLSSIRNLAIDNCSKLETLPDWLEMLPSLQVIRLSGCPVLHSIPDGLQQHCNIKIYVEDCPNLPAEAFSFLKQPAKTSGKSVATRVKKVKENIFTNDDELVFELNSDEDES